MEILNKYLESKEKNTCYGCGACEKVCPHHAIHMETDEHGFQYPVINKDLCTKCGRCRKACPIHPEIPAHEEKSFYVMEHRDEDVAKSSQSGGAFTAISDCILSKNGSVYGAIIKQNLTVEHSRATNAKQRNAMRGSKYVQSIIPLTIIESIEADLKTGNRVLFTGTPCQCAMIQKNYGSYDNLFVCDFICHGVPSPKVWKNYLEYASKKYGEIKSVRFRNKKYVGKGWHSESLFTEDGKEHVANEYAALFYSHLFHRDCCYACQFASSARYSDITIGGFLDQKLMNFNEKYDASMFFINTDKGRQLFEEFHDHVRWQKGRIEYFKNQPCLYHPIECPAETISAWMDFQTEGLAYILENYITPELKQKYHLDINL